MKRCSPPSASTPVYTVGVEKHSQLQVYKFLHEHVDQINEVKMPKPQKYSIAENYDIGRFEI